MAATAALSLLALLWLSVVQASAADATGGTAAPVASVAAKPVNAAGAGGVQAPVAQGTGGSEYGIAPVRNSSHAARPRARVGGSHHTAHPSRRRAHAHHTPAKPHPAAPKPAPAPTPKPAPAPTPPPPAAQIPGVPTPTQTVAEGAMFPVRGPHSFGGPENRFGAPRGNHTHQGQDILAVEGLPDVAPLPGTIITTGNQPGGAGWYVAESAIDGFGLFFAHCQANSIQVTAGQVVSAGTTLCTLGATGDATAPHLHFEMWVGGWHTPGSYPIDPLPYLEAWEAAGR